MKFAEPLIIVDLQKGFDLPPGLVRRVERYAQRFRRRVKVHNGRSTGDAAPSPRCTLNPRRRLRQAFGVPDVDCHVVARRAKTGGRRGSTH